MYENQGDFQVAEDFYKYGMNNEPENGDYPLALAILLEKQGKDEQAEVLFRQAIEFIEFASIFKFDDFYTKLAKLLEKRGRHEEAKELLSKAKELYNIFII